MIEIIILRYDLSGAFHAATSASTSGTRNREALVFAFAARACKERESNGNEILAAPEHMTTGLVDFPARVKSFVEQL
jgi:hypothetical protein